jgi:prepilin-type N-terminal cleavage/methylation domain-containing protein
MAMIGRTEIETKEKSLAQRLRAARGGFTLIEIMVVVAIIIILVAISVAVGVQVKRNAARNSTNATLTALQGVMGDYLKDHPDLAYGDTAWVQNITAYSPHSIDSLPFSGSGATRKILDGWGNSIRYVPSNFDPAKHSISSLKKNAAFFQSNGPDGLPDTDDDMFSPPIAPQ